MQFLKYRRERYLNKSYGHPGSIMTIANSVKVHRVD